ncbi:MAG: hypothetical protein M3P38_03260 [Chloroflexota bacterium]|nr:hypothetical protein [Chloroflexota bacterium]
MRISRAVPAKLGVFVALFVATLLFVQWWDFTVPSVGRATYQAVFLVNGQTYFGRYYDRLGPYAKIENAFYIQQTRAADPDAAPESKLVRRGSELHEPTSAMLIAKSAILFVEDLQEGSSVAQFMSKETK